MNHDPKCQPLPESRYGTEMPYAIRQAIDSDRHFVLDSWLRSRFDRLRSRDRWSRVKTHEWYSYHRPRAQELLDECSVLVAVDPEPSAVNDCEYW